VTPSPLVALVLALALQRTWRLAAEDNFPPLVWARDHVVGYQGEIAGAPVIRRPLLAEWLRCVWCSGLWLAAGWYTGWLLEPRWTLYAAAPLALSAAAASLQSFLPT
jgi:hypothetical protein